MSPGKPHYFTTTFSEMVAQVTLLGILRNFQEHNVENFEIEIYGYTVDKQKKFWRKTNRHGKWELTPGEMHQFQNVMSILEEHGNTTLYFGVIYQKPVKTEHVDMTISVVPELKKKDEE